MGWEFPVSIYLSVEDTDLAPLTRKPQIKILQEQISDALAQGAKPLTGSKAIMGTGNYFEPTVLVDVNHDMKLMREESFRPIIGIQKVEDDSGAIELLNEGSPQSLFFRAGSRRTR